MKLSVVIPAHNEEACISAVVDNLIKALEENRIDREIILVNDNSTDNTPRVLPGDQKGPGICQRRYRGNLYG